MRFRLTQDDINRGKLVDPGQWYKMRVEKVYEEPTKAGDSMNTKVDFRILNGTFTGILVTRTFSEKAPGFIIPYLKAFGYDITADEEYNLKATESREVEAFVQHREYQNQKYNDAVDFRPAK